MNAWRRKNLGFAVRVVGTLISTALFIWLISRQKWDVVLDKASGIAIWALVLALVCYLLSYGFNTLRWCFLLWAQGVRISYWRAWRLAWAGNFASQFLPSTIGGDGFRMLAVHPYTGSKSITIGSVALDRIINMSAWVCLLPAPLLVFGASLQSLLGRPAGLSPALPVQALALPPVLQKLFEKYFPKILAAVRLWSSRPSAFLYAFLVAWPSNLLPVAATWLIAHQLGMQASFGQVLAVQTVTYFISVLPISVNGYGLREAVFTSLYTALGASLEQASTLALVTRFIAILSTVPGALWLTSAVTGSFDLDGPESPAAPPPTP